MVKGQQKEMEIGGDMVKGQQKEMEIGGYIGKKSTKGVGDRWVYW